MYGCQMYFMFMFSIQVSCLVRLLCMITLHVTQLTSIFRRTQLSGRVIMYEKIMYNVTFQIQLCCIHYKVYIVEFETSQKWMY